MKRLYFLVPDTQSASAIIGELRASEISADHVFVVGSDHVELEQAHLHEAGVLHGTKLLNGLTAGLALGGTTGLLAGLAAVSFPPAGLVLGGAAVVGMGVMGAGVGGWLGSFLGMSATDPGIHQYEKEIKQGQLLLMVDIPAERELEIQELVHRHHPEAQIGTIPHHQLKLSGLFAHEAPPERNDYWDSRNL
ncbi:MAG: DUF1269 domain-containing protein [Gammaproteobacteria bacterium]|nr:DUF1269 domain-containing protein [Gammaproteobacteria bacterium]